MNIFNQNVKKKLNYQNFIDSELNHIIFNSFVKMSISEKYIENLWTDIEHFSIFVTKFFLIISCFVVFEIFNSKLNAAMMTKNFTFEKNLSIVSMQNVHRLMRYVFENIETNVFFNFQIMIIIQNTVWKTIQKNFIFNYKVNIKFQTLRAKNQWQQYSKFANSHCDENLIFVICLIEKKNHAQK